MLNFQVLIDMRTCLYCLKEITNGASLFDYLLFDDVICPFCRKLMSYKPKSFKLEKYQLFALYPYHQLFKTLLLQYKENYDEALAPLFLYPYIKKLSHKFHGYTIALVPSSLENNYRRGFNHLYLIFKDLKIPVIEPFYKDGNYNQNNLNKNLRKNIIKHIHLKDTPIPNRILLVDDVVTTGSTMLACAKLLEQKNIKVLLFSLSYPEEWLK